MFRQTLFKILKKTGRALFRSYSECNTGKKENLSAVLHGIKDLRMETRPIPKIKGNQVLLQMESIGICGSDVHYYTDGKIGPFVLEQPMVIGHEASGTVVEIGEAVTTLQPGDKVAIEPGYGCRMCSYCKEGRYHLCPDMVFCATPPFDGNLCRYFAHEADFCFKLPGGLNFDEGALIEPLAVGVHACKRANVRFGDVVLVNGAGPIGIVSMLAAKAFGASAVLITDTNDFRLNLAKECGANFVLKVNEKQSDESVLKQIVETLGECPNVSVECSGAEQSIRTALQVTKTGGVVVLVGMKQFEMNLPLGSPIFREVDIKGIFRYNNDYPDAIEMVRLGKANVQRLITHHFKIEDSLEAFKTAMTGKGNPVKIMLHANPSWKPTPKFSQKCKD